LQFFIFFIVHMTTFKTFNEQLISYNFHIIHTTLEKLEKTELFLPRCIAYVGYTFNIS